MAGSVNKAIVVGYLGRKPDVRRTQSGNAVVSFSVATNETWRDKATGERKQRTDWHNVVIFNEGLCKVAEQYLDKGSHVYLEGQMKTRKWVDKDIERYTTEVVLGPFGAVLQMLDKSEGGGRPTPEPDSYGRESSGAPGPAPSAPDVDPEIPF